VKKFVEMLVVICFAMFGLIGTCKAQRFSSNDRRAVVLNAFYALRTSHDGGCSITNSAGQCLSNWNYLNNDFPTYSNLKASYGCNSSDWAVTGDPCPNLMGTVVPSFYSNLLSYGLSSAGGSYGAIGRGGQCRFFANLVIERGLQASIIFPTYSAMWNNGLGVQTDLTKAAEGDILTSNPSFAPFFHTAIVVEIKRDGFGNVTGLDLIDSNFISDLGTTQNREAIVRHLLVIANQPAGKYGLWKGAPYYNQPYVP